MSAYCVDEVQSSTSRLGETASFSESWKWDLWLLRQAHNIDIKSDSNDLNHHHAQLELKDKELVIA